MKKYIIPALAILVILSSCGESKKEGNAVLNDKKAALEKLKKDALTVEEEKELFAQVAKMLEISENELRDYFEMPLKTYKDYKHQDYLFDLGSSILYRLKLDKLIRK